MDMMFGALSTAELVRVYLPLDPESDTARMVHDEILERIEGDPDAALIVWMESMPDRHDLLTPARQVLRLYGYPRRRPDRPYRSGGGQ